MRKEQKRRETDKGIRISSCSGIDTIRRYKTRVSFLLTRIFCCYFNLFEEVFSFFLQVFKGELGVWARVGNISLSYD
jgi:hypothetical protein